MKTIQRIIAIAVTIATIGVTNVMAQVKVGDNPSAINANSALEVESTNKGLLLPRVALTSLTSATPLSAHVAGMAVFNTTNNVLDDLTPGIYYNDGTKWNRASKDDSQTMTEGSDAPSGACTTPGEMYTDTLSSSATNGKVWVCSGGSWVEYTNQIDENSTPFYLFATLLDAKGNKTSPIRRSGGIGITPSASWSFATLRAGTAGNNGVGISPNDLSVQRTGSGANLSLTKRTVSQGHRYIDFRVFGAIQGYVGAGNSANIVFAQSSDVRLKENIQPTRYSISDLMKVEVKDYNYIADSTKSRTIGFIAQDLYKVYPDAVTVGGEDVKENPWTVDYSKLTPFLVKSIQDQQQQIQDQQQKIQDQEKELSMLKNLVNERFAQLEQQNISTNKRKVARKKSGKKSSVLVTSR